MASMDATTRITDQAMWCVITPTTMPTTAIPRTASHPMRPQRVRYAFSHAVAAVAAATGAFAAGNCVSRREAAARRYRGECKASGGSTAWTPHV